MTPLGNRGEIPEQNKLPPGETRKADRARTYRGIADAMADQWGCERGLFRLSNPDAPARTSPEVVGVLRRVARELERKGT